MDARSWGWPVESRSYHDFYCKTVMDEETEMGETFRRDEELQRVWEEEIQRRKQAEETKASDSQRTDDQVSNVGKAHKGKVGTDRRVSAAVTPPRLGRKVDKEIDDWNGVVGRLSSGGSIIHGWD